MFEKTLYGNTSYDENFRGYYIPYELPFDDATDTYYTITPTFENRPGLLAYTLYGDEKYQWVFMVYNRDMITNPLTDFRTGVVLRVPSKNRIISVAG